jgi:hypothetical protein
LSITRNITVNLSRKSSLEVQRGRPTPGVDSMKVVAPECWLDGTGKPKSCMYIVCDEFGNLPRFEHKPFRMKDVTQWHSTIAAIQKDVSYKVVMESVHRWSVDAYKSYIGSFEASRRKKFMHKNEFEEKQIIHEAKRQSELEIFLEKISVEPAIIRVRKILNQYSHRKFELKLPENFIIIMILTSLDYFVKVCPSDQEFLPVPDLKISPTHNSVYKS